MKQFASYNRTLQELVRYVEEIDLQDEMMNGYDFDEFVRDFCIERDIKIDPTSEQTTSQHERFRISTETAPQKKIKNYKKVFLKVYRKVAKETHPDKFASLEQTPEIVEKIKLFKKASESAKKKDWSRLMHVVHLLGVTPPSFTDVTIAMKSEIEKLTAKKKNNSTSFGIMFKNCEDVACREDLAKKYLKLIYNIDIKE